MEDAPSELPPSRVGLGSPPFFAVALVLLYAGDAIFGPHELAPVLFGALFLASIVLRHTQLVPLTSLIALTHVIWLTLSTWLNNIPVLPLLAPLLVWLVPIVWAGRHHDTLGWLRAGRLDPTTRWLVAFTSVGFAIALAIWCTLTDNLSMGANTLASTAALPRWLLFVGAIPLFALTNAATEEAVFRGVFQHALSPVFTHPAIGVVLQAVAFAAIHYQAGSPNGIAGFIITLAYGSILGYLRLRSGGMVAPFIAHLVADLVIAIMLAWHAMPATFGNA